MSFWVKSAAPILRFTVAGLPTGCLQQRKVKNSTPPRTIGGRQTDGVWHRTSPHIGVPNIESDWVPPSKRSRISATFARIAKPTLQCVFAPKT
jgi:hypothetical protein